MVPLLLRRAAQDRLALHTSTDFLLFDEHERGPSDDLRLQFEAVSQFPEEERKIVKALLDGMIIKFQIKQMVGNLSSLNKPFFSG